jgi:FAD/FMN-containing dehydrogenase
MSAAAATNPGTELVAELRTQFGADAVIDAQQELAFYSQDVFGAGAELAAVLRPGSVAELQAMVRTITLAGAPVVARGGGLSYTDAYLAERHGSVLIDLARLNRIVECNAGDRYVTVECGVTWAALKQTLDAAGLRTPYWGPLSGLRATVGGALSQGSIFLGSGRHGSVGDSVLGLEIVSADGTLLRTGSAAAGNTSPFFRYFGPELTGLFVGDAGTLGIKARATLRLLPAAAAVDFQSWEFDDAKALLDAMAEVARSGHASECFAFDPVLAGMRMKRASLMSDVKTLGNVVKAGGLVEGLKLVAAGRRFLDPDKWSMHLSVEADGTAELKERMADLRLKIGNDGREVENSIPKVLRANPFVPPNNMLGPAGERWVPVHGIVPHSRAGAAHAACVSAFARFRDRFAQYRVETAFLLSTIAAQAVLIEPVFYWPDSHSAYHKRMVEPEYLARSGEPAPAPGAQQLIAEAKRAVADALREVGATHFQIGKFYRWREGRDPAFLALFDAIKRTLDPAGLMNPGALSL